MFVESIRDSDKCVGCSNCKNTCPVNAITMVANPEGFIVPQIDHSICINCKNCESVCPHKELKYKQMSELPDALIVRARNKNLLKTSASGGLCSILAYHYIEKLGGYVCGAVYNDDFTVRHIVSNDAADIKRMQQSKYVQSNLMDCFPIIKEKLRDGQHVLMIGTGCQIYALKKFLTKEYDTLFCVDLVCHGTPSPKVQMEYLKWLKQKHGEVIALNNRNKKLYPHSYVSTYSATFESGETVINRYSDDPMADAFFQHLSIRKSCFECQFKSVHRISDLTIGDFWFSEMYGFGEDRLGVNLCLVQSKKGKSVLSKIEDQIETKLIDTETAIILNGGMIYSSCKENKNRQQFFDTLGTEPFDSLVYRLDGISSKSKKKNQMREVLAPILRKTKYYNKQLAKSAQSRKNRNIPEESVGLKYY